MSSSIGTLFRLTTFGESHGLAIGGIIDGCPSGLNIDTEDIQNFLSLRRPGASKIYSQRNELDKVEFLSGIFNGVTLGTPIGFIIKNKDVKSKDYSDLKDIFRPSHADFTYEKKYGLRDYRGGGRSSARETANWVVGGAIALQILSQKNIRITSYVDSIGPICINPDSSDFNLNIIYDNDIRCPIASKAEEMKRLVSICQKNGDTIGGSISTIVTGVPAGLGEPVFHKLHAAISGAIMSINGCKGIEFGAGFDLTRKQGSEVNDCFVFKSGRVTTKTNYSGGILGGISNGQDIFFRTAFKPVSTILKKQSTINSDMQEITISPSGRHDPCVVPRAVPIVDSLTAMTILDYYLLNKTKKTSNI